MMITIEDIKNWSKPHPLANVISLKDRKGGRVSCFGNSKIKFSIVGGATGLYGDFEDTFEVAIVDEDGNFRTKYFVGGTDDVIGWMNSDDVEKLVNSILKKEDVVVDM